MRVDPTSQVTAPRSSKHLGCGELSAGTLAAVKLLKIAQVEGQRRLQSFAGNLPTGIVVGVAMAVIDQQSVQEFEHVPRHSQPFQGGNQFRIGHRVVEEFAEVGFGVTTGAGTEAIIGDAVQ